MSSPDSSRPPPTSKHRTLALLIFFGVVVLLYTVHLFSMQVVDKYIYVSRADTTTRRSSPIPAKRGEIYDRNYTTPIAGNTLTFAVDITPADAPNNEIKNILSRLAKVLDISVDNLYRKVPEQNYNSFHAIELNRNVSYEQIVIISENIHKFPGVNFYSRPIREYHYGSDISHVLGFVGEITPEELQVLYNKGYTDQSIIGKAGIERQYDIHLQGKDGRRYRRVDAQGRQVTDENIENVLPELGNNIVLTIDTKIQQLAAKALGDRVGSVVVLKPSSGEILAMVSYPSFDPNNFVGRDSREVIARLSRDRRAPFLNRAIQASGSPASTFKVLMAAAAIEEGAIDLDETINTKLYYRIGNRRVGEWGLDYRITGFGPLTLHEGLANSSNYFFANLGHERLGADAILEYSDNFGLGMQTGVDLPNESSGLLPNKNWKKQTFGEPWVGGDTVNLSLGQGFLEVTPLQLANMVALIVNDGVLYTPHLLHNIRDQESGALIHEPTPNVSRTVDLSRDTYAKTREAMRSVVTEGTANAVITTDSVEVAGKTGTGEVGLDEQWHSWFVAFAPYETEDPDERVVVVVWVDATNKWEWWAPKASDLILHGIFKDMTFEEVVRDLRPWYL